MWMQDFFSNFAPELLIMTIMRKLIFLFLMMCCSFEMHAIELDGKYQSKSGELMFIFKSDSLYVNIAQSQRNVSSFKLVKTKENDDSKTFNAYESFLQNGKITYREVLIRVTRKNDKEFLLEYFGKDKDREYNTSERYNLMLVE